MEVVQTGGKWSGPAARPASTPREGKKGAAAALLVRIALGLGVLVSVYLLAYTPINDWFHSLRMARLIDGYERAVAALTQEERDAMLQAARACNEESPEGIHFQLSDEELREYNAQLDITGTGMMGYLRIAKLGVLLPIYHTTDAEVLEEAVGHIPGSSLPVGGESCHTVLCGHRDLATAYLFHDLDKLELGDTFTLTVLDETITYEVDQIRIVLPTDIADLAIESGRDYCTLVTCHPHGSSEYRMLVRGRRV